MSELLIILVIVLGVIISYFGIRHQLDQRQLIDFQQRYHRTMTPLQIRKSRRFFFQSEVRKSPRMRQRQLFMQIGRWLTIGGLVLIGAQLLGVPSFSDDDQVWFTLTWALILVGISLAGSMRWLLNRELYAITAPDPAVDHVDLTTTPTKLGQHLGRHQAGLAISLSILLLTFTVGSATETISPSLLNQNASVSPFGARWHWQLSWSTRTKATPSTSSTTSQTTEAAEDSSSSSQTNAGTTTRQRSESVSETTHTRAFHDAAFVRTLPSTKQRYLTEQDQVGLISMYYLAVTHSSPAGLEDDPSAKYTYHRISNYAPTTYILTRKAINGHQTFTYLAQIDDQQVVRLYHFKQPDGALTDLHGLVPKYTEYPNSAVKFGQLITGYYSDQDGPFHRTMWAMQPGQPWQY